MGKHGKRRALVEPVIHRKKYGKAGAAIALAFAVFGAGTATAQEPCGVELVLAMDVSRSVSTPEYRLQMDGLADAFRDEEVKSAVRTTQGGVMATVMIWGDRRQQRQSTPWTHLRTDADMDAFATEIELTRRTFGFTLTGLGAAMLFAEKLGETNPLPCRRRVIDVSGDGVWNDGPDPKEVRATFPADLTVNGLVIMGAKPSPLPYYQQNVIGGPGSFVEVANTFEDYAEAIRFKLLRELAPSLSMVAE